MIIRSNKGRKILRNIFRGLGVSAVALFFQACYGMPPDLENYVTISGVVISESERTPIQGIKVSGNGLYAYCYTNANGTFNIHAPMQDVYNIDFEDVDGPLNGSFKPLSKEIAFKDINHEKPLHIFMETEI